MKLSESEFWELTMCEYVALLERFKESRQAEDLRAGMICSSIYNTQRSKEDKPLHPEDFFASLRDIEKEEPVNSSLGKWMLLAADLKQQQANKNK